jgi:hypothetical protein
MEIKYNLGNYSQKEAYEKVNILLDDLVKKHSNLISNPVKNWNSFKDKMDFGFEAHGYNISGDIKLQGKELIFYGKLPWALRLSSGKIEEIITKQLDELFPKNK